MPDPFTPSRLAQARKSLYGARPGGTRSSDTRASDLARIEREAFDEQNRVLKAEAQAREEAAEAQRKADEATEKAAAKAAKATADAAQRTENNALEEQYRRDRRPMYVDADSRIKPIHTDEEWARQKAEKGRKLQAENDKKQAEDRTKAELGKVEADQGVLAENDQTIQRATQREELERDQKRQHLKRIQKEFEDKLKAYDDSALELTPAQATAAAGTVALAKQRLADLDTAEFERKKTALDFATQQDVRKAALKKQESAVRRGEFSPEKTVAEGRSAPLTVVDGGTKPPLITDPAQFEAAAQQHAAEVQAFDAEQAAQQQKLEALKAKNARLMSMPHAAADVSADGQWHRDLIPEVNALGQAAQSKAPAWQAQQAKMAAQFETLNASAKAINEKARVENDKAKAQQQKDRAAAYQQLNALPGTSKLGDELKAVHDAVDQHRGGDDAGLMEWADQETERIQAAAKMPLEREREKVYQELNAVPGAKGVGDDLAKLDAEVEPHLGGDDAGVKEYYEQRRKEILGKVQQGSKQAQEATNAIYAKLADQLFEQNVHEPWWARTTDKRIESDPDKLLTAYATTTTAQEQVSFEQAVQELTQKLGGKAETQGVMGTPVRSPGRQQAINLLRDARANDWSSGDTSAPVRYDSKGTILVNPAKYLDETAFKAAVEEAEGTPEEKAAVLKQFPELNQRAAKAQIDTLRTLGVYRDWEAQQPADMTEAEKLAKFREENSGMFSTGAWKVRLNQALLGVASGVVGLAQSAVGTYEAITRSRGAMDAYKSLARDSSQMSEASNALPTGQWVNMGTSMVISTVPSLAVGGVAGAMRQSSLQNAAKTLTLKQVLKGGKGIAGLKTAEQASKAAQAFGLKSAAAAAGLQTFGTMYGNAAEGYMKRGDSEESALNKAFIPALASAATTFLLTAAGGTKGAEALLRQESFRKNFKSWFQAVASGSVQEGLLEEAPDQLMQGMLERYTYNPRKSWNEIAEETLVAGIGGALMGAGFEAMNTRFQPEKVESLESIAAAALQPKNTPSPAPSLVGTAQGTPEAAPVEPQASGAVKWAAAEAALANFDATTTLPPEVADKTAQKARVLLKIAQGAKAESLDNDDLHLVGLHRDDAGKLTTGHMSKNGWKKGPNPNGSPQPVETVNGEFVITDRQIERLRNKDVGLGALADAIALPAAERRAQILAKENANAATPPDPAQVAAVLYDLRSAETGAALDLDEIELALDNAERRLQKGKPMDWPVDRTWLPNVSTASVPALKELLGSSEGIAAMRLRIDELKQQNETPPAAPAPQRGTDEVAARDARGAGAEAAPAPAQAQAQPGNTAAVGDPAEVLDLSTPQAAAAFLDGNGLMAVDASSARVAAINRWFQRGGIAEVIRRGTEEMQAHEKENADNPNFRRIQIIQEWKDTIAALKGKRPAVKATTPALKPQNKQISAPDDQIPMSWPEAAAAEGPAALPPEQEQRATEISRELAKRGLDEATAQAVAAEIVGEQGVVGDNYALQMSAPEFDAALKARGWERHNAGGKTRYRRVMSDVEQVPGVQRAQRGEAKAEEVLAGNVPSSKVNVPGQGSKPPAKRNKPLIEREDWQQAKGRVLARFQAQIKARRDAAMGKLSAGAKHPAQVKANEELREVIARMNLLEELIDTRYAGAFDDVILKAMGAGGGLYAQPTATDAQGRATQVALVIDLDIFMESGSRTAAGIERTLNEEMSHRVDLMVSSPAEAVALARAIHAARPGVFNAAWKQYHAFGIESGSVPAKPPAELSDQQAFEMYFEATRMIHQGAFTTEKSELPDVGLLRKIYLYLNRWIKQMRREIGKLPQELQDAWQSRIDIAEIMLGKLEKQAVAADKAGLDDVEPPSRQAVKQSKGQDPEIDDEIDAAWEAEQKARRKAPVFTPGQQALRGLRTITDPDNDEINIISRIALQGGMGVYSPKVLKARAQEGKDKGGELDWLERADIPPFWKGVIFRRGTKQEVQAMLEQLHREGYFPGVAEAGDVTGEMLAAKIKDVLDRYTALKKGEVSNLDEAEGEHFGKLEAQRVEFERSTESGPLKVRPADLQVGDVMQVKGDDGKLHPVKVKGMETRPLESDEEFNPEANPGHRLGPDGPEVIESVTLEDGTTFGVQTIDGQEGLYVDEFKVKSGADWYDSLREAILSKKLTDEDALLHFMEHEGLGADAAWGDIVGGLQRKLGLSMKKAQKMLASVFDTSAKDQEWSESEKAAAMDSPLGAAAKRSLLEKPQYHSTPNETAAQSILQSGQVVPPVLPHSRGKLTPVVGRVYMAPSTETAAIYSLGGVMMGQVDQPGWAPWWDREGRDGKPRGRYGYVFQIDPDSVQDIQPDEDNVGELAFKAMDGKLPNAPYWLKSMGERLATPREKQDKWAYANYASLGKRMLKQMSDLQKLDLIERFNTNIAHAGPVRVLKAWKVDKSRAGELAKDGSNLLEVAEPVPLSNQQTLASAPKRAPSPAAADYQAQMDWMNRQAQAMGAKDADELGSKKPDLFKRLAAEWRVKHARDSEGKLVQNEAIRGIFESLYGSKNPKTLGRDDAGNLSRSLAASAEAHTRGNLRPGEAGPASPTAESVRAEKARLIDWARDQNLLLQKLPEAFTPYSAADVGMMEHHVFVAGDRMVKITREGNYGIWPVPHLGEFDLRNSASTPLRYLQRVLETNAILGEDLVLHGVLADRQGNVQIITSQPRYSGRKANAEWSALPEDTPVAERDRVYRAAIAAVRDYFAQIGFAPVGSDNRTYYRPGDNTAVFDAHLSNLMWVDAEEGRILVPFDVTVMHPTGQLAENFKALKLPQILASAQKRRASGPSLFGEDTLNFLGDRNTMGLGEMVKAPAEVKGQEVKTEAPSNQDEDTMTREQLLDHNVFTYLRKYHDDATIIRMAESADGGAKIIQELRKQKAITPANRFAKGGIVYQNPETGETRRADTGFTAFESKWGSFSWMLTDAVREFEANSQSPAPPVSPSPSPAFSLESTTPAQLKAEAERKKLKEALQARQDKPLIGTQGDIGQMDMLGGNDLLSAPPVKVEPRQEVKATPSSSQAEPRGLADFGVKLGGARKDRVPTIQEELTDEDIARKPLSEIWPKSEIDSIEDIDLAAFATAVRGEIPTKPQRGYKLNVWVSKVKAVKELMRHAQEKGVPEMITQWRSPKYNLGALADKVNLLQAMDREHWGRIGRVENYPDAYRYETGAGNMTKIPSPHATAEVDGKTIRATNLDDLQAAVLAKVSEGKTEPKMQFEVRGRTDGKTGIGTWRINKKGDSLYRPLKVFADVNAKEAFAYIQAHHAELVAAWESVKERDNVKETDLRRDTNRPRTAEDYRQGQDATPEMFTEAFGFRGVEFGNWVSQGANAKERQGMMNEAYDALHDLASILNVPTKALSLNGQLGLGFGSRGHGKFAAHYEPGTLVINLTKTRGAGSLAHEMFHALDHYFQRFRGTNLGYITEGPETRYVNTKTGHTLSVERWQQLQGLRGGRLVNEADWKLMEGVRPEVEESFAALVKALDDSPMAKRARLNDKGKQGYWGSVIERAARAFENYVIFKMQQKGYQNDYLANVVSIEDFARDPGRYPYLLEDEIEPVAKAFDDLFATIQTREEDGKVALFSAAKRSPAITALAQSARNPAAMPAATRGLFAQRPGASQPLKSQPGTGAEAWFPSQWGSDQVIEAAYQDALSGQSSAMLSLERVFLHAQKRQPGLKQADFLAAVHRAYDEGRVLLEGANSQTEIDSERVTLAGTPVGTAVRMAAARNDETRMANEEGLSSAAKRSEPDRGRVGVGGRVGGQTDELAHEAATSPRNDLPEPSQAQKEAGNYPKGHVTIGGHEISIENPAGSKRQPEWPPLKDHYGYFKGTNAKDGDHVDVFVKPGTAADYAGPVHVVRQVKVVKGQGGQDVATKQFDEYKVMLGYPTAEEARAAYLRNYEHGWPGMQRMTTHTAAEFARIKESVFTVKPKDVPGVRESDQVLASAAKRSALDKTAAFIGKTLPTATASGLAKAGSAIVEKTGIQKPLAALGSNKVDKFIYQHVFKPLVWDRVTSAQEAVKKWLNKPGLPNGILKGVVDQTLPLWNVPREYLAHYHEAQRKAAWGREKAMDVIRALSHDAKVSDLAYPKEFVDDPSWRVRMFDAMEGKTPMDQLPEPLQKLAARLRLLLEETGRDLVKQGLLNLDTFNELRDTGWMPRYTEDEAEAAGGSWLKAFKLGIKDMKAQRSTAWHIVDTSRKDPKEKDQYAIVSREEGGKKNRWRFRNAQHMKAFYEDFVKREAVRFLQDGGKDVTNLMAALSKDEQDAVRDGIRGLTPAAVDLPGTLSPNLNNIVERAVELQRLRYKKEKPFEPDKLIKDPVYSVARYVMAQTHNAATMELLKHVAKNKEWTSEVSLEGHTEIPDNPRFGPLAKKHLRADIATQVLEHVGVDGAYMQFYDSMLRKWKAGKLVLNPGSHVRDAVGNTVFAYLGGNSIWNPGNLPYYRDAITALRDGGDAYAELIEQQVLGGDAFTTQVQAGLKGLLPDTKTVEDMNPGMIAKLFMGFGAGVRGSYEYLSELRKLPDDFYKTAAYLKYKSQGMSPAEAAAEVRKWFPYYDRLGKSGFHKYFMGRVANPFVSFFRESVRIFGRAAMERPLALSTSLAFAYGVSQLSMMMLGLGDDDEEAIKRSARGKAGKLAHLIPGLSGVPLFSILLPNRTDEGQLQQWDISAVMPFADLLGTKVEDMETEDNWQRFFRTMLSGSPVISLTLAQYNNLDPFTGQKIVQDDETGTERTVTRLKHAAGVALPPLTPVVGVHANTLTNAGRRTNGLNMRNKWQSYIRATVGLDVRSADPNLRTEALYFRKKHNLPLNNSSNIYDHPLKSRLAKDIKGELIQDAPNIDTIAEAMARLEASGNAVRSPKQMADLLDSLDPAKIIKQEFRRRLINSFSPEGKRVYQSQQAEFKKATQRVPNVMAAARKQMSYGEKTPKTP